MDRMVLLLNRHPKFHASLTNRLWPISSMQLKCLTHSVALLFWKIPQKANKQSKVQPKTNIGHHRQDL